MAFAVIRHQLNVLATHLTIREMSVFLWLKLWRIFWLERAMKS